MRVAIDKNVTYSIMGMRYGLTRSTRILNGKKYCVFHNAADMIIPSKLPLNFVLFPQTLYRNYLILILPHVDCLEVFWA